MVFTIHEFQITNSGMDSSLIRLDCGGVKQRGSQVERFLTISLCMQYREFAYLG